MKWLAAFLLLIISCIGHDRVDKIEIVYKGFVGINNYECQCFWQPTQKLEVR
jgi:hypothetical protein